MKRFTALKIAQELQLLNAPVTDVRFHGLSMEPLLQEGDRIVIEKVTFEDIQLGDIITYRNQDKYPTRRVVGKTEQGLSLWCDNWPNLRFGAEAKDVLGRVVSRDRQGNLLSNSDLKWQQLTQKAWRKYRLSQGKRFWNRVRRRLRIILNVNKI